MLCPEERIESMPRRQDPLSVTEKKVGQDQFKASAIAAWLGVDTVRRNEKGAAP